MDDGGVLFRGGDSGSSIFLIRSGMVMISSRSGDMVTSRIVGEGCVIGEDAILKKPYGYSAECLNRVSIDEFRVSDIPESPIITGIARMHSEAWIDRQAAQVGNLKIRLIDKLLELSKSGEGIDGGWVRLGGSITHLMLAEMIGSSRPTVSIYLNKWLRSKKCVRASGVGVVEVHPENIKRLRRQVSE
jgi:CRP-like cAMP-binding protein